MGIAFYTLSAVTLLSAVLAITRRAAMHGLLFLVVSFLALAVLIATLGAPFSAALEVIVYAGAILVLFLFAIMMLTVPKSARATSMGRFARATAALSILIGAVFFCEVFLVASGALTNAQLPAVGIAQIGTALLGPYAIGVELASMLLLAGVIGAHHLGDTKDLFEKETTAS